MAGNRPMTQNPPSLTPLGRALLDSIREGVVVFDNDGHVLYANQEGQRSIGNGSPNGNLPGSEELLPRRSAGGARILPLRVPDSQAGAAAPSSTRSGRC